MARNDDDDDRPRKKRRRDDDDDDDDDNDFDDDDNRPIKKKRKRYASPMDSGFLGFLVFRKMVGDWLLVVLYWLVVLGFIGVGLFSIVMSFVAMRQAGAMALLGVLYGLGMMILGPVVYRVVFEMMILVYRIHEMLAEIRDNTK